MDPCRGGSLQRLPHLWRAPVPFAQGAFSPHIRAKPTACHARTWAGPVLRAAEMMRCNKKSEWVPSRPEPAWTGVSVKL